ncbi:IclR family transcriptional regulator [Lutispora sp.]|uniref:IclR family transcriptional regulator n=1 Tax=Lutispora sp. TaxID=2828727 RepID=UPI003562CE7E
MNNNIMKDTKTIGSVIKAVEVLEELAKSEDGLGVTEISNRLNYGVSATYHLLNTLKQCNIIEQDKKTKKYRIGFELFRICGMAKRQNALASLAQPYLDKLREMVGETSNLVVLDGNEVIYIAQSESTKLLKLFTQLGAKVPFYCTGGGKAILSYQPKKVQDLVLNNTNFIKFTGNTLSDINELVRELDIIRQQGYAMDNEEREEGVTCIAAPVFDCYGEAIASISISGPTYRLKEKGITTIIKNVTDTAKELSESLGYVEK